MEKIVRYQKDGVASGNYKGLCFDWNIKDQTLMFVTMFGGLHTKQDYASRDYLETYLKDYFNDEV